MDKKKKITIIGGGYVGMSMHAALKNSDFDIVHFEKVSTTIHHERIQQDNRTFAITVATKKFFETLNIATNWSSDTAIKKIHVSVQNSFGVLQLDALKEKQDALGYVVRAGDIGLSLLNFLSAKALQFSVEIIEIESLENGWNIKYIQNQQQHTIFSDLIIFAEGSENALSKTLQPSIFLKKYQESAFVAQLQTTHPHNQVAYERFTEHGPLALLPAGQHVTMVWALKDDHPLAGKIQNEKYLCEQLNTVFGDRLGQFTALCSPVASYPLFFSKAEKLVGKNYALIGNSAHTLHPVAGQGFNLSIRGVARLAQCLIEKADYEMLYDALSKYSEQQLHDVERTALFSQTLLNTFESKNFFCQQLRAKGLFFIDFLSPLKSLLGRFGSGQLQKLPKLCCGILLDWGGDNEKPS